MHQNYAIDHKSPASSSAMLSQQEARDCSMGSTNFECTPLLSQKKFGAELHRIDLKSIKNEYVYIIKEMLAIHGLLIFRNQSLEDHHLVQFAKMVGSGKLESSARKISHGRTVKDVSYLTNLKDVDGAALGFPGDTTDFWHSDQEFREVPASISILFCLIPSESGGATSFATTAVDNVEVEDTELSVLRKLWSTRKPAASHDNVPKLKVSHPVILSNPFTRREFIYISENTIEFISDDYVSNQELKSFFLNKILRNENLYSHQWEMGDLLLYDNMQLLHRREEFRGIRFLKGLKIYPDGEYTSSPDGRVMGNADGL